MPVHHLINPATTLQPTTADLWETACGLGYPAALWRLPNQSDKHLIVSFDPVLPRVAADLEELPAGFLISPFHNFADLVPADGTTAPARTLFLRADLQARFTVDGETNLTTVPGDRASQFSEALLNYQTTAPTAGPTDPSALAAPTVLADPDAQARYVRDVAQAIEAMQRDEFRKVVLSRTKRVQFADAPNAVALFDKLCATYPTAFISAVSLPERGQIWMSATPERLVSVDADGVFRTLSLAGTQSALESDGTPKRPSEAMWSQKKLKSRP